MLERFYKDMPDKDILNLHINAAAWQFLIWHPVADEWWNEECYAKAYIDAMAKPAIHTTKEQHPFPILCI